MESIGVEAVRIETAGEDNGFGQAFTLRFSIDGLPLYRCSCARPEIHAVRNHNLLYEKRRQKYLEVRDEFIYRTPRGFGQMLNASGYDGKE